MLFKHRESSHGFALETCVIHTQPVVERRHRISVRLCIADSERESITMLT